MRGVTKDVGVDKAEIKFLLTRLMRGVTTTSPTLKLVLIISTHTPHARRDVSLLDKLVSLPFLLTRLMRGVT